MGLKLANNSISRLAAGIAAGDLALSVTAGQGALFPVLAAGDFFPATIARMSDGVSEIVTVTARTADAFTIVRAQEGTAALAFLAGDLIELRLTAKLVTDLQMDVAINAAADKATPIGADKLGIWDSVSGALKGVLFSNLNLLWANIAGSVTQAFSVSPATAATHAIPASQARIKNDIRNGQFRIAQRGTSIVSPATGAYDLDGWASGYTTSALVTVAQVAGSATGKLARQTTVTTADASIAAPDQFNERQVVEGYRIVKYVGNTFTIAFRAKVPVVGVHCLVLRNGGADRTYIHEINFPVANVWQDCAVTVTGGLPTAGTWNYTNGIGLYVGFSHACGSSYVTTPDAWQTGNYFGTANQVNDLATVGNVWALEDFRMCLGTYCPPDDQTYEEDLAECRRYYQLQQVNARGYVAAAGQTIATPIYLSPMRATPTTSVITAPGQVGVTAASINGLSNIGGRYDMTLSGAGEGYSLGGVYAFIAEL